MVRPNPLYPLKLRQSELIKSFLEWYSSRPIRNTKRQHTTAFQETGQLKQRDQSECLKGEIIKRRKYKSLGNNGE